MRLDNIKMIDIIPPYFQDDVTVIGLCAAADYILSQLYEHVLRMDFSTRLNVLSETDLDYIADAERIVWYDKSSTKEVKINVIKNAEKVFYTLGTVAAVESVMNDIFGECEIKEWFDYTGDPYHFKISTYNPEVTEEKAKMFTNAIRHVKRKGAIFDSVEIALNADYKLNHGFKLYSGDAVTLTQEG